MINSLKEFCYSIFQSSSERIKNPIIGTYILSFIIINWRAFLVLFFSNTTIENRIKFVDENWYSSTAIWIPAIITGIYIFIIPYANLLIDKFLSWYRKYQIIKEHDTRKTLLVNLEIEASLERKVADAKAGTSEINDLQRKVQVLTEQNNILSSQTITQNENYNRVLEENKKQIRVLNEEVISKNRELERYSSNRFIKLPEDLNVSFKKFDWTTRLHFIEFVESHIIDSVNPVSTSINNKDIQKLIELEFITVKNDIYELTLLGKIFYEFCISLQDDVPF